MKPFFLISALIVSILPSALKAQNINLMAELTAGNLSSSIDQFKISGNILYFTGRVGMSNAYHLWKTDGTANGTTDLLSNPNGYYITALTSFNNELYFVANDGVHGYELWHSDGTVAGTGMLMDINPGPASGLDTTGNAMPAMAIKIMNSKMYVCANDGIHGLELWSSDGTVQGTQMVIDLNAHPSIYSGWGVVNIFEAAGNKIFFEGEDGNGNDGLWITDGTAAGTSFLKPLLYGQNFFGFNNQLCYTDFDGLGNIDFWISDGTINGTVKVYQNVGPGPFSDYTVKGNQLFFYATKTLYVTDGTAAGTAVLKDSLDYGPQGNVNPFNQKKISLVPFGNKVFFSASRSNSGGVELWESDGTAAGTKLFLDLDGTSASSYPAGLTVANSKLYFKAQDAVRVELWVCDGTVAGTHKIAKPGANIVLTTGPLAATYNLSGPVCVHNNLLIFANTYDSLVGKELYKIDLPLGIEETSPSDNDLSIYPNPSEGIFTIEFKNNSYTKLDVLNKLGQRVYTQSINMQQSKQQIQLDDLSNGIYFARVSGRKGIITKKIMIER